MSRNCGRCCWWTTPPVPDLSAALPFVIALAAALVVVAVIVVAVRRHHRSPRMRAAADDAAAQAAEALLLLDDAVDDLDAAFEAADALDAPDAPTDLRRARTAARRDRDRGFADVSALDDLATSPSRRRDQARRVAQALDAARERVHTLGDRLETWAAANRTPAALLAAARARRDEVVAAIGDPEPLLVVLRQRFDPADGADAERAAAAATAALSEADAALRDAQHDATPASLQRVVRALRSASRHGSAVENAHRFVLQAADNAGGEISDARAEIETALAMAAARPSDVAASATGVLREALRDLDLASASVSRRPGAAIATVARVREVRDAALGDAPNPRQRIEAARAALPGTLACARAAFTAAEARDDRPLIADRLRLERARRELAAARAATDATDALTHARAARRALLDEKS